MLKKSVFCVTAARQQADRIAEHLRQESFSKNDISVLFSDRGTTGELAPENTPKAPTGAVAGAGADNFIGEALGWVDGIGGLAIPGAGSYIAAGPVAAALSSAAVGGIAGRLMGLGISENEARGYERAVENGNILLGVHTEDVGDIARAKDIFRQAGGQDICTGGWAATTTGGATSELLTAA